MWALYFFSGGASTYKPGVWAHACSLLGGEAVKHTAGFGSDPDGVGSVLVGGELSLL